MAEFTTFNDLPVETKQRIRAIQAKAAGQRTTAEAAILTANNDAIENEVLERNEALEITRAQGVTLPTGLSGFAKSAVFLKSNVAAGTQAMYENTGDTTTAAWNLIGGINTSDIADDAVTTDKIAADAVTGAKIADGEITLAKLATGITPSHIVVFAGEFTTAGGDANEAITVTGALATDLVHVTLHTKGASPVTILQAQAAADVINVVMSGDPSTDHVLTYSVLRAAA